MDRVELRRFLDEEQALGLKWRDNAQQAVRELEETVDQMRDYFKRKGKAALKAEELAQFEDAKEALREAQKDLDFFEGVKAGIDAVARPLRDRMAAEELANAGKWVPKPFKPRRR